MEIYAFAPGINPADIEVQLENGVLTIAGERNANLHDNDEKTNIHIDERFTGRFRRVFTLSKELDTGKVTADFNNGVLKLRIPKTAYAQPRRIEVKVA